MKMKELKSHVIPPHTLKNEDIKKYTILIPDLVHIHFQILRNVFKAYGYNVVVLDNMGPAVAEEGLKYVHNDTCYPALLVIGQMIDALNSGKYDLNSTAVMITQTGGGCRASNYIHLLRKALRKAGYEDIPVISLNISGLEKDSSFKITLPMIVKAVAVLCYGDLLMLLHNQTTPYEVEKGASQRLIDKWVNELSAQLIAGKGLTRGAMKTNMRAILEDYAAVKRDMVPKVKVGVVGEIYVKYSSLANNCLEDFLRSQDCEINVPGILGFMSFKVDNRLEDIKLYGGSKAKYFVCKKLLGILLGYEKMLIDLCCEFPQFEPPCAYPDLKEMVKGVIGYGAKMGEGWLLTAEMVELIHKGYGNIVCAQPFGCLPNHIVGKGMIRRLRQLYPKSNIVPIDYDPGATRVNQENRIKLMLAVAKENLESEIKLAEENKKKNCPKRKKAVVTNA